MRHSDLINKIKEDNWTCLRYASETLYFRNDYEELMDIIEFIIKKQEQNMLEIINLIKNLKK